MDSYEKKYNEAMLRADEAVQKGCLDKDMFDIIFPPEESEDEMVRKWILEKVQGYADSGIPCSDEIQMANKALAWLEEQKDKNCLACDQHLKGYIAGRKVTEEEKQKEQSLRDFIDDFPYSDQKEPKPAWSEEDKKILDDVSHILIGLNYKQIAKDYKQAVEKLIYARPGWKPSEEQMEALLWCVAHLGGADRRVLAELYEHLKMLNDGQITR